MAKFESSIKQVPHPQEAVYRNLSDLSNLEKVRDRVPEDKVQDFSFDKDTVSVNVPPVGKISIRICDREALIRPCLFTSGFRCCPLRQRLQK